MREKGGTGRKIRVYGFNTANNNILAFTVKQKLERRQEKWDREQWERHTVNGLGVDSNQGLCSSFMTMGQPDELYWLTAANGIYYFIRGKKPLKTKTCAVKEYLVGAYESSAKGSKHFNHSWAAVAPDSIVWSDLGHVGPPANMLPHYDSQICYKECILLRLKKKENTQSQKTH